MNTVWYSGLLGYGVLFVSACAGLFHWRVRTRRSHPPVEFKLLRGPGELTLRSIRNLDAGLPLALLFTVLGPLIGGLGLFAVVWHLAGVARIVGGAVAGLVFLAGLFLSGRFIVRRLGLREELELRFLGERAVAEELAPLLAQGFRMFHDVSILGVGDRLDLDHVLVGPGGVVVVETETRQRPAKQEGPRRHEVTFDGKQLVWPWGPDRNTVAQLEAQAACLSKWLAQSSGFKLLVRPILAVPGWWVEVTGRGSVVAVNQRQILNAIDLRPETALSAEQMERLCRLLEEHCRDVTA